MPKPPDAYAEAFGVATIDELVGDSRSARLASDTEALDRQLHELPPLHGRAPITDDPFAPDPEFVNTGRAADAPTIPELQQRHREWSDLVARGAQAPASHAHTPEPTAQAEVAAQLWSEFGSRHPELTADPQAVERAASKLASGFDPNRREDFYDAIAAELSESDDSRTALTSGRGRGGQGAPRKFGEADSRTALTADMRNASRGWQH